MDINNRHISNLRKKLKKKRHTQSSRKRMSKNISADLLKRLSALSPEKEKSKSPKHHPKHHHQPSSGKRKKYVSKYKSKREEMEKLKLQPLGEKERYTSHRR